jgi:hypothetical protein
MKVNAWRVGLGVKEWRWLTSGPHSKEFPDLNKATNQILAGETNSHVEIKNLGKLGGRKSNLKHFSLLQLLPNLYGF